MKFTINNFNGIQVLEHHEYPRFKADITFNDPLSDLENIEMIDQCTDVSLLSSVMRAAGEFIYKFKNQ